MREFGRIGSPGRIMMDSFQNEEPARMAFCKIAGGKLRRGYCRVDDSENGNDPLSCILLTEPYGHACDLIFGLSRAQV